jgi:hypothetical protein
MVPQLIQPLSSLIYFLIKLAAILMCSGEKKTLTPAATHIFFDKIGSNFDVLTGKKTLTPAATHIFFEKIGSNFDMLRRKKN